MCLMPSQQLVPHGEGRCKYKESPCKKIRDEIRNNNEYKIEQRNLHLREKLEGKLEHIQGKTMYQGLCPYLRSRAQLHPVSTDSPVWKKGAHPAAAFTPSAISGTLLLTWRLILNNQLDRIHNPET